MKPTALRPQALRDPQGEARYDRKEGGTRLAMKVAKATNGALDPVELEPGMGAPRLGKLLVIPGLRTWRVEKFPLQWCYLERGDPLDVVRLVEERQDILTILGDEVGSNGSRRMLGRGTGASVNDRSAAGWSPRRLAESDPSATSTTSNSSP